MTYPQAAIEAAQSIQPSMAGQIFRDVYAVRHYFDDGQDYLRELGEHYDRKWARYLEQCDKLGYERKPQV